MTAMLNHAPILTTLRPGVLLVNSSGDVNEYVITGGFAEVTPEGVTVIAERAMIKADVTQEDMDAIVSTAKAALEGSNETTQDAATKTHADVVVLAIALGFDAA